MEPSKKTLIVIVGPTAIGKTAAAVELAHTLKTEIISADSRQFFREMSIGTAKPSPQELGAVKHHFINSHSIADDFSAGAFEQEAMKLIALLFEKHDTAIMVGGSGLYIKAVCEGFDELPAILPNVRERLNTELAENGLFYIQEKLRTGDPDYFKQADVNNPQRIIRALEVLESTGRPYSSFRKAGIQKRPFNIIKIGLNIPREQLYQRINLRVDDMIAQGLVEEAETLLGHRKLNALNTVGYTELFNYFDGLTDLRTAINLIKQHTRNFAKRQITWFNKDAEIRWHQPGAQLTETLLKSLI